MIDLKLITLSGHHVDQMIHELSVPTTAGTIVINEGHAPLLGAVAPGILSITHENGKESEELGVYNGTIEVLDNVIRVLVDEVDTPDSVVWEDAESALKRAKDLKEKAGDAVSISEAQAMMDRQAVRLQLAGLRKGTKKKRY